MGKISKNAVRGFTIVELLVVIVVIGILAAITVLAYNNVTNKARESAVISDLNNNSRLLELYKAENGSYPKAPLDNGTNCPSDPVADNKKCLKFSNGNSFNYSVQGSGATQSFILTVTNGNIIYKVTPNTAPYVPVALPTPTGLRFQVFTIGSFTGGITWTLYSYKTVDGVKNYSAGSAISYTGVNWQTIVSWDDMGVDGYILSSSFHSSDGSTGEYWKDVGNVKVYGDNVVYTGWNVGIPSF